MTSDSDDYTIYYHVKILISFDACTLAVGNYALWEFGKYITCDLSIMIWHKPHVSSKNIIPKAAKTLPIVALKCHNQLFPRNFCFGHFWLLNSTTNELILS